MTINDIKEFATQNKVPVVRDQTLQILIEQIKQSNPKNILEIGTAIGYSGIHMLLNSNATLTTIEKDKDKFEIAKQNFESMNLSSRVDMKLLDAKEYLATCNQKFDFIFLDGPKGQYIYYLDFIKNLMNQNTILFSDDVLFYGLIKKEGFIHHKKRTIVNNLRKFLQVTNEYPFKSQLLEIEDGILITKLDIK